MQLPTKQTLRTDAADLQFRAYTTAEALPLYSGGFPSWQQEQDGRHKLKLGLSSLELKFGLGNLRLDLSNPHGAFALQAWAASIGRIEAVVAQAEAAKS